MLTVFCLQVITYLSGVQGGVRATLLNSGGGSSTCWVTLFIGPGDTDLGEAASILLWWDSC